ncbi:S9 family peptidase, partial [Pseudomonas syringae pv. tagetis]
WAYDLNILFFGDLDESHRPARLHRESLCSSSAEQVFDEPDGRFFLHCIPSSTERQLIIMLNSKTTSQTWVLDDDHPLH